MSHDMSNELHKRVYELAVYDGARDLAWKYKREVDGMRLALERLGVKNKRAIKAVEAAQSSKDYSIDDYRGRRVDEAVVECLKDCLRPLYGF